MDHTHRQSGHRHVAGANSFLQCLASECCIGRIVDTDLVEQQCDFVCGERCMVRNEDDVRNAIYRSPRSKLDLHVDLQRYRWLGESIGNGCSDIDACSDDHLERFTQ